MVRQPHQAARERPERNGPAADQARMAQRTRHGTTVAARESVDAESRILRLDRAIEAPVVASAAQFFRVVNPLGSASSRA
jgi:hypothetical protein